MYYASRITGWSMLSISSGYKSFEFKSDGAPYGYSSFLSTQCPDLPGVNLIVVEGPFNTYKATRKLIESFPVSISQVAYIPKTEELVYTDVFARSVSDRTVRYSPGVYANRIFNKYTDWVWTPM